MARQEAHVSRDDAAPGRPGLARRWAGGVLPAGRPTGLAFSAGLVVTALTGALMTTGPAAAAPLSRAVAAPAGVTAISPGRPAVRWLTPGAAATAPGARPMTANKAAATPAMAVLYGASCTSRTACTAVGVITTSNGKYARTLAERWNGSKWAVQSTPTPLSGGLVGGLLGGVACTSPTACVAAGYSYSKARLALLGESWNGRKWITQPSATPVPGGVASGISCTWRNDCTASGLRSGGGTLAEHWNGRKWSAEATQRRGVLAGVSCPASKNCTAVGEVITGKALAEHWNGKAWSLQSARSPAQTDQLSSVSCHPARDCMAVGSAGSSTAAAPLAEQWTGSAWGLLTAVDPVPGDTAEFTSVSCQSATNCTAVGDAMNAASTTDATLAEHWDGTAWTVETSPSPGKFSALTSVSCTSATFCVAVGGRALSASGAASPLVETWNGATWSVQAAPR